MVSVKLKKTIEFRGHRSTHLVERVLTGLYGTIDDVPKENRDAVEHPMFVGRLAPKVHHICRKTKHTPKVGDEVRFYEGTERLPWSTEVGGVQEFQILYHDLGNNRQRAEFIFDGKTLGEIRTVGGVLTHQDPEVVKFVLYEGWPSVDMFISQFKTTCTYNLVHFGFMWYPEPQANNDSVED